MWCWTSYFTVYSPRSKGVAILVNKNIPHYQYICNDEDYAGGYIVLFCQMYGQLFTLVNVYNHKEDKQVLGRLSQYLQDMITGILVIGGDFNTVLDPDFDRISASEHRQHTALRPHLEEFISSRKLVDIWASLHPNEQAFTRSQNTRMLDIWSYTLLPILLYIYYQTNRLFRCRCSCCCIHGCISVLIGI
uniref:Endonuclease/exonuclease/phosphatase domain-containing protein n=1 Tax=Oncorhynchus tshawytscha TaxID=74940 RepID=A0A8C8EVU9_ONCTS